MKSVKEGKVISTAQVKQQSSISLTRIDSVTVFVDWIGLDKGGTIRRKLIHNGRVIADSQTCTRFPKKYEQFSPTDDALLKKGSGWMGWFSNFIPKSFNHEPQNLDPAAAVKFEQAVEEAIRSTVPEKSQSWNFGDPEPKSK